MKRTISDQKSIDPNKITNSLMEDIEAIPTKKINTGKEDSIKTYCRIKPIDNNFYPFKTSDNDKKVLIYTVEEANFKQNSNSFSFSRIFDHTVNQVEVFQFTCIPLIDDLLENKKSGLLFAYGLTNAGKTHTIIGK